MRTPHDASSIGRLQRRADFLRVAKGRRWHATAMTVQAAPAPSTDATSAARQDASTGARVGFTLTRKVGNAVVRNRARRRLKEALRLAPGLPLRADHDYVIIGRVAAVQVPFAQLCAELDRAFRALHDKTARRTEARPMGPAP